jgi:hypothetical protein
LFHASLENSDPTIAAPITGSTARLQSPVPQNAPKLAAATSGRRKIVRPRRTSAASAPTLATVKLVWIAAPSRTPRIFTAVSRATMTIATTRCGDRPSWIRPPGIANEPRSRKTSGVIDGQSTPRKRPNATATAAIVPLWITVNSVHP